MITWFFVDTILIYHNAQNIVNPIKVGVSGKALNKVNIEGNKVEFNIFPNPVNEKLNIEIQGDMMSVCKLYNSKGQLIKTLHLEYGLNAFNINNLENGLYYIQIPTKTGSITQKIVKI